MVKCICVLIVGFLKRKAAHDKDNHWHNKEYCDNILVQSHATLFILVLTLYYVNNIYLILNTFNALTWSNRDQHAWQHYAGAIGISRSFSFSFITSLCSFSFITSLCSFSLSTGYFSSLLNIDKPN